MKHTDAPGNIHAYVRSREDRKEMFFGVGIALFLALCFSISIAVASRAPVKAKDSGTVISTGTIISSSGTICAGLYGRDMSVVNMTPWRTALRAARAAWEKQLHEALPSMKLVPGNGECGMDAVIACADPKTMTIRINGDWSDFTPTKMSTVMMHEIAHLLGVPHIDGDPLMNSVYSQDLSAPTPRAVALAKLHLPLE
jgi:hypothetical protein